MSSGSHPARVVLGIVAALLGIGIALDATLLDQTLAPDTAGLRALIIVAVAFAVGEAVVMHVELGKNAHSVSLAELTLTVGLFYLTPYQLLTARLIGGGLVLFVLRHQRPLKLLFNLALWTCDVAVASLVFHGLGGSLDAAPARMAASAAAAAVSAGLVDALAVNLVIAVTGAGLDLQRAVRFLRTCLISAAGCVTAGVVCVAALKLSPWYVFPLAALAGAYLWAFSRLASLQTQIANVRVLNDFAQELSRTRHGYEVAHTVLRRSTAVLRADHATLWLLEGDHGSWQLTHFNADDLDVSTWDAPEPRPLWLERGHLSRHEVADVDAPAALRRALESEAPVVLPASFRHPDSAAALRVLGLKDAVLVAVRGEQGLNGVLVVGNRQGEVNTFTRDDGLLLQLLAGHAGAALSNSLLVEQLDHDSQHDPLTGLANRSKFHAHLTDALQVAGESAQQTLEQPGGSVAVLLMDLDRFKEVNDTLGHHHGDLLLQVVAQRLSEALREGDLLARLGGDEFAVLLSGVTDEQAVATAERMLHALGQSVLLRGVEAEVGASIGVAHLPAQRSGLDANTLLQRADVAMYAAKQRYTGIHVYRDELDGYSLRRLAMAGGLRTAIDEGQLTLRYQPQAQLSDGAIVGVEALVRWEHPVYGEIAPDEFIALAEQTGVIRELTRYVLDTALAANAALVAAGFPVTVSVNLSVRNLLEPDLTSAIQTLLAEHGVTGRSLILEITESQLMIDPDRTVEVLRNLAAAGIRLSIDDFGTGYSSLAYLKRLPVTEVKIDKSFVRDLASNEEDGAIISSIITLAHTLRLDIVAEGVEDAATLDRLRDLGCGNVQGFHIARPLPLDDLVIWLGGQHVSPRAPRLRPLPSPRDSAERRGLLGRT